MRHSTKQSTTASPSTSPAVSREVGIGQLVYFPDAEAGYLLGRISDIGSETLAVEPIGGGHSAKFPYKDALPALSSDAKDVDDNCALMHLNEGTLLQNCKQRYKRKQIYTYTANILICINPYELIPHLYSKATILNYCGKSLGTLPPHVFAIADRAYREMRRFKQSQSVIVSGESGAGKTESQKHILSYLCECWGSAVGKLEQRILETNPILEAFGNAKTLRNNNSSRFGKFVEVHFDTKYEVAGGYVSHYLLEKTRVCHQQPNERSFHIFYQLFTDYNLANHLRLTNPDHFKFLSHGCTSYFTSPESLKRLQKERLSRECAAGGALQDPVVDDIKDFQRLRRALVDIGMAEEECKQMFEVLGGILHLGNVGFDDSGDDARGGSRVLASSDTALHTAAALLGLEPAHLKGGLISRMMQPTRGGGVKGTLIMVPLKGRDAAAARDALAKTIYSRLFDHIVAVINKSIPFGKSAAYIGVLDIAGFEFFENNSFEQLCINYCNERLQAFFNSRILKQEQELYEKEGLNVPKIHYSDNQDCIDLFEAKPSGLLESLDEEGKLPSPSTTHFTSGVLRVHAAHPRLSTPRKGLLRQYREMKDDEGFIVRHYAGEVCYATELFLEKNNDALHISLEALVEQSTNPFLKQLFQKPKQGDEPHASKRKVRGGDASGGGKLAFQSVGSKFKAQLLLLVQKLTDTGTHFVRCIKPNSDVAAGIFHGGQILSQLRCAGMTSVLNLMHAGYPSRAVFSDLYAAYQKVMPSQLSRLDSRLFCKCLFYALGLNDTDYKFGLTRVFFRAGKFAEFDKLMQQDPAEMAQLVQKVQTWLHRVRWKKAQYGVWSCIKLKNKILYRRQNLITIQSALRGHLTRKKTRPRIRVYRKSNFLLLELAKLDSLLAKLRDDNERIRWKDQMEKMRADLEDLLSAIKSDKAGMNTEAYRALSENLLSSFDGYLRQLKNQLSREEEKERLAKIELEAKAKQRIEEEEKRRNDEQMSLTLKRRQLETQRQALLEEEKAETARQPSAKRSAAVGNGQPLLAGSGKLATSTSTGTDAVRVSAGVSAGTQTDLAEARANGSKYDLINWTYAKLRDAINTSTNIDFLEACRHEFHRRLKGYRDWVSDTTSGGGQPERRPAFGHATPTMTQNSGGAAPKQIQRYFRVPFEKPAGTTNYAPRGYPISSSGFWYAHFDGQLVVRQMEIHPTKPPLLLMTGRDDFKLCELSLDQTGLTRKKGAEILAVDFDTLWYKNGGPEWPTRRVS